MLAVYAAPFHNNRSKGPKDGMEKAIMKCAFRYELSNRRHGVSRQ